MQGVMCGGRFRVVSLGCNDRRLRHWLSGSVAPSLYVAQWLMWHAQFGRGKCSARFVVNMRMGTLYSCEKVTHHAGHIVRPQVAVGSVAQWRHHLQLDRRRGHHGSAWQHIAIV